MTPLLQLLGLSESPAAMVMVLKKTLSNWILVGNSVCSVFKGVLNLVFHRGAQ